MIKNMILSLALLLCTTPDMACKKKKTSEDPVEQHKIETPVVVVPSPPQPGFLYREGSKLMLNGKQYTSVGFNSFHLIGCGNSGTNFDAAQIDSAFDALPPNVLVRIWAFPGNRTRIDLVVKAAEKHKIKLILTLGDGRSGCGHQDGAPAGDGSGKIPDWYVNGYKTTYLPHVTDMAKYYKDSPAVGMWELLNEPGEADVPTLKTWMDIVASEIKKNDPNHLVSTGALAPWTYDGESNYKMLHEGGNIDVGTLHEYDYDYNNQKTIESPHFAPALRAMNSLNKVLIVEETGIKAGAGCATDFQTRASDMKRKFDLYLSKGAKSVLVWELSRNPGGCDPSFSPFDPMYEMIKTYPANLITY